MVSQHENIYKHLLCLLLLFNSQSWKKKNQLEEPENYKSKDEKQFEIREKDENFIKSLLGGRRERF